MSGIVIVKKGGSGSATQDNIDIFRYYRTGGRGTLPLLTQLNEGQSFEVSEVQSLWIEVNVYKPAANDNGGTSVNRIYKILNLGKGTYGLGGTKNIEESNLKQFPETELLVSDIENLESTQKIFIEDLGGLTIRQYVNSANPVLAIQNPSDGAVLIKIGTAPDYISYWFVGDGGEYGQGALQAEELDFQLLADEVPLLVTEQHRVAIQTKSQLLGVLDPNILYVLDGKFNLSAGEYIYTSGNLTLDGFGFDISQINKNVAGESIFKSLAGGSANLSLNKFQLSSGLSSVFDIYDSNGTHAIEINDVNFQGCSSLGRIKGYRQFTGVTLGVYGCATGLQLSGSWNGFKVTNTNCFGFGNAGTLFRKDVDTLFANRLFIEVNADFPVGSKLADFVESNFASNELFQINSSILKYDGQINDSNASAVIPTISANNPKCLWRSNVGLPDTALERVVENSNISVAYTINWLNDTYLLTMTGNTIFTEINLPASGKNTEEIKIYLQGNFTPTFPTNWNTNKVGTFKKGELNQITLKYLRNGLYFMKIDNSLTVYPAPDVSSVSPALLPQATSVLNIYGSFFTPATIVSIAGHMVNNVVFKNQGWLELSVTTSLLEGDFALTISNGTQITYPNKVSVYLGVVFQPNTADWINVNSSMEVENNSATIKIYNAISTADWNKQFDVTKKWSFRWRQEISPLGANLNVGSEPTRGVRLLKVSDNSVLLHAHKPGSQDVLYMVGQPGYINFNFNGICDIRCANGVLTFYSNGNYIGTFPYILTENLKLSLVLESWNVRDVKYIELTT